MSYILVAKPGFLEASRSELPWLVSPVKSLVGAIATHQTE